MGALPCPKCTHNHPDCFARGEIDKTACRALINTYFGNRRDCPFYKPAAQAWREWEEANQRRLLKGDI